ncbi:hypothetical protein GCM10009527_047470 [Actinomadura nitritigenes]|uniref:Helix-turn-helix domain-containing protein n=1 Tax=Actinomadura nitritigenes TaxID=134602 RepID=A0ABS3QTH3_9ACTN|nr:helix-turn-helix transcriptional regulator [Actinomadura nitritigenes]MBO2437280.1 helix-turn-helix domain-containing protein [Actinomadura nitritigenes]
MAVDQQTFQDTLDRVFARQDTLEACKSRDLGAILRILGRHGVTQGQVASRTGIAQGRLSEYKTGKRVPEKTSVFESFANGLNMPAPARRAMGLAPRQEADPTPQNGGSDLQTPLDAFDILQLATEAGRRGGEVRRREMLELAATIGAGMAFGRNDMWERLAYAITKPAAVDEPLVREMELRSEGFHQLDLVMPSRSLFKAILAHLNELTTLLNGMADDPHNELRKRLIISAGESSVLAGWWASDFGNMAAARTLYETAERAAKEASDPAINACLLAYKSYIPSMRGAHGRSRALLTEALRVLPASVSPTTEAWLAARHAEESAALGDRKQALESWGRAEDAFSVADPAEDRSWTCFFDQARFDSCRISTYANIPGRLDKAEEIASDMIASVGDFEQKRVAIVLGDIAAAHLRHGHINEASRIAKDGLAAVRESEFAMWLPKFEEVAKGVNQWRTKDPVRSFLEDLAVTKRQFGASAR